MAKVIHTHERLKQDLNMSKGHVRTVISVRDEMKEVLSHAEDPNFFLSVDVVSRWFDKLESLHLDVKANPKLLTNEQVLGDDDA